MRSDPGATEFGRRAAARRRSRAELRRGRGARARAESAPLQIRRRQVLLALSCALFCSYGQEGAAQQPNVEEVRFELPPSSAIQDMVMSVGACPGPWDPVVSPAGTKVALTARGPEGPLQWTKELTLTYAESNVVASESVIVMASAPVDFLKSRETLLLGLLPVRQVSRTNLVTYDWSLPQDGPPRDAVDALLALDRGESLSLDVLMSLDLDGLTVTHPTSGSVELLGCGEVAVGDEMHSVRAFETTLPISAANAGGKARVFYYKRRVLVSDSLVWPVVIDEGNDSYTVVTEVNR